MFGKPPKHPKKIEIKPYFENMLVYRENVSTKDHLNYARHVMLFDLPDRRSKFVEYYQKHDQPFSPPFKIVRK